MLPEPRGKILAGVKPATQCDFSDGQSAFLRSNCAARSRRQSFRNSIGPTFTSSRQYFENAVTPMPQRSAMLLMVHARCSRTDYFQHLGGTIPPRAGARSNGEFPASVALTRRQGCQSTAGLSGQPSVKRREAYPKRSHTGPARGKTAQWKAWRCRQDFQYAAIAR